MPQNKGLAEKIVKEAAKIPLESQKHILSVINAMLFTRETINQKQALKKGKAKITLKMKSGCKASCTVTVK